MATKKPAAITVADAHPDAWQRFEHAVDAGVKSGPKPKTAKKKKSGAAKNESKRSTRKPR